MLSQIFTAGGIPCIDNPRLSPENIREQLRRKYLFYDGGLRKNRGVGQGIVRMLFNDKAHAAQHAVPQIFIQPDLFLPAQEAQVGKLLRQQNRLGVGPDRTAQKKMNERVPLLLRQRHQGILHRKIQIPLPRHIAGLNPLQTDNPMDQGLATVKQAVFSSNRGMDRKLRGQGCGKFVRPAEHPRRILEKHKRYPVLYEIQGKVKVRARYVDSRKRG